MLLLAFYLLASNLIALVAITAPGVYPLNALRAANNLVFGHRLKIISRLLFLALTLIIVWAIVLFPIIAIDLLLKSWLTFLSGVPLVPAAMLFMICFSFVYIAAYLYLLYRRILDESQS